MEEREGMLLDFLDGIVRFCWNVLKGILSVVLKTAMVLCTIAMVGLPTLWALNGMVPGTPTEVLGGTCVIFFVGLVIGAIHKILYDEF